MATSYDSIVVGLGAMGSAALYHLARRGQRVLGLEAFGLGHTMGSSHGESRIIRLAYFEHPDYVPLLRRAYTHWEALPDEADVELLRITGGVFVGPPGGTLVSGSLQSARRHSLPHEVIDAAEIQRRFPALRPVGGDVALYEPRAGILFPERCIEVHLRLALRAGAEGRFEAPVRRWTASAEDVRVETDSGSYVARRLVLTAGTWLGKLLDGLSLPLRPERNVVFWLQPRESPALFDPDRLPIFMWETGDAGTYYGIPHLQRPGVKVARHHSGDYCDPDTVSRVATVEDEAPVRRFVARALPALDGPVAGSTVCLYTNTPDGHFVVDRHPQLPSVVFAGGFSGHGFKLAGVMGEVLAELVIDGRTTWEADFLRATRFGLGNGAVSRPVSS